MRKCIPIISAVLFLTMGMTAYAGKTGTWSGSDTHQFFPTIIKALLGNGYALVPSQAFFGDCSDGNVTISAGTTVLTRDMFYNNLTINGTGVIDTQNQRIFICGTLDLTAAQAGAIDDNGSNGGNGGNSGGGGNAGATTAVGTNLTGRAGGAGGTGTAATAVQGAVGVGGNAVSGSYGGTSGAGGAGGAGAGAGGRGQVVSANFPMRDITTWYLPSTGAGGQVFVGGSGPGGGSGNGDGTTAGGGGGGGGGASGQTVYIAANIIKTGAGTVANTIQANGGAGGNGGSPSGTCTLGCGGGGGGAGGGGGWIVIKYNAKSGSPVTNLVQATGGIGGTAGTHKNAGGVDGVAGNLTPSVAGLIQILNLSTGAYITSTSGNSNL